MDGIGGDVKRKVWLANLAGDPVSDAISFARVASNHCTKIEVHLVKSTDIEKNKAKLEAQWDGVTSLPKTHTPHCVIPVSQYIVKSTM